MMPASSSEAIGALRELMAKQQITEVLHSYCRGVDRLDEDLVREIYHADAYDDHGYWKGRGWDFAPFVVKRLREANEWTTHTISNILIEVRGDLALSESQVMVHLKRRESREPIIDVMGARYVDRFSLRDGCWKIDERTVVLDWHWELDAQSQGPPIALDQFSTGKRDRSDPIYRMLKHTTVR